MSDYGIRVGPRFLSSPLWALSARAFRLWCFLAVKSQHAVIHRTMGDGQRVTIARGQWLTSCRKLRSDVGYRSLSAVVSDLKELAAAGVISSQFVRARCSRNRNTGVPRSGTGGCSRSENTGQAMANLLTVYGINQLAEGGVPKSGTKEQESDHNGLSRDDREWLLAMKQLVAEGR